MQIGDAGAMSFLAARFETERGVEAGRPAPGVEKVLANGMNAQIPISCLPLSASAPDSVPGFLLDAERQALELVVRGAPLTEVLSYLTEIVESHAEDDVVAAILLLDNDGRLRTGAAPGLPDEYNAAVDGIKAEIGLGTCSEAAVSQDVVITVDIASDPNWQTIKHLPLGLGLKAAWSHPIVSGRGETLATFGTYFRECRPPSERERLLVSVLAHTAALAIERKRAEAIRDQQERVIQCAVEAAEMGTWRYTFADSICECSPRAQELYGLPSPRWVHDEDGVKSILHPDDLAVMWEKVRQACAPGGGGRYAVEYRVRKPEGGWRWLSAWGVVEYDDSGRPVALVGGSRDITDVKEAQEHQKLLQRELSHRVQNTLAVVQALAAQTLRESSDLDAFKERFFGRVQALSQTHSLLSETMWHDASIDQIADAVLAPFQSEGRIKVRGPHVRVEPARAVALCLLLHELATNAMKYGAFASADGQLEVKWTVAARDADRKLVTLVWNERGRTQTHTSSPSSGFGSKLIQASVDQLDGSIERAFSDEGLRCEIKFPESDTSDRVLPAA